MSSWWEDELLELEEMREEEAWPPPWSSRLICRCRGVEESEVLALIGQGADLEEIVARTGATTGCSGCKGPILSLLRAK